MSQPPSTDVRAIGLVRVVATTGEGAVRMVADAVAADRAEVFAFCNAHSVNLARRDPAFARVLNRAVVFNDGVGLDIAGRWLHGQPFPENLNGTDLTGRVLAALERTGARVFLLGSPPGVADAAARVIAERFPGLVIAGVRHGFFDLHDPEVAEQVAAARPDVVLVGMGQPRQEYWAAANRERLGCVQLCVGAYLDFVSGTMPRAPALVRRARMEWAYRLWREPRRLAGRYLVGNAVFLAGVARDRLRRGRSGR